MDIREYSKNHIVLLDGAMGTYFNRLHPEAGEAEEANLSHPDWITQIHREYIEAGAQVIRTNTFAVNHTLFSEPEDAAAQIRAAVANARKACVQTQTSFSAREQACADLPETQPVLIAASIGPIRQEVEQTQEDVLAEYDRLVEIFLEEGITFFILETFAEPKWASLVAQRIRQRCREAFVLAEFSVNPSGYTKFGYSMQQLINAYVPAAGRKEPDEVLDAFGFNCGVGAAHLNRLLKRLVFPGECCFCALPNAGYQQELRGRLRYSDDPWYYARQMETVVAQGANLVGGCCGTTPAHIRALAGMLRKRQQTGETVAQKRIAASAPASVQVTEANPFMDKLLSGTQKVYVVELDSPFGADAQKFRRGAYLLRENAVDMITVSDSPMARARADAALMANYIQQQEGIPVMPHIACRDRNLIGLRAQILGAYINGIRNLLLITGDPVAKEDRNAITGVFDVNSIRLMEYVSNMNKQIFADAPIYYGGALNYAGVNIDAIARRMEKKIEAGCSYFLTQPIFSKEDVERIKQLKARVNTKIICCIMPLVSYKNALFIHNEMPGIHVTDEVLSRYQPDMSRAEAQEVAVELCVEIAQRLYDTADGFYLITPFQRVELVNEIIDRIRTLAQETV